MFWSRQEMFPEEAYFSHCITLCNNSFFSITNGSFYMWWNSFSRFGMHLGSLYDPYALELCLHLSFFRMTPRFSRPSLTKEARIQKTVFLNGAFVSSIVARNRCFFLILMPIMTMTMMWDFQHWSAWSAMDLILLVFSVHDRRHIRITLLAPSKWSTTSLFHMDILHLSSVTTAAAAVATNNTLQHKTASCIPPKKWQCNSALPLYTLLVTPGKTCYKY